jgi:uncharacterized protein
VPWAAPPPTAAWQHRGSRSGFEVVWFARDGGGHLLTGRTVAVQDGRPWTVDYEVLVDAGWRTRRARVSGRSGTGSRSVRLRGDGRGRWQVDGRAAPSLDGCLDVDLEASAVTNALPVRRLGLAPGEDAAAPAVYVRAEDLAVERLEQHYRRRDDDQGDGHGQTYDYAAPAFDFRCRLRYDAAGLVVDYPDIAVRAG